MSWEREDIIRFLDDYPLPKDFMWGGMVVQPRYHVTGYGKWLFESGPYYPALRGLPQLLCELVPEFVTREQRLPLPEELAAILTQQETKLGPLFRLQAPPPDITDGRETQREPSGNPNQTQALPNPTPDVPQGYSQS